MEGDMGRFLRTSLLLRVLSILALLTVPLAYCQPGPVVQTQTVVDILHQLSDTADVIFAGQVLAIRRPNDGVVEVEFRVDQAIRGCTAGTPYVLREWAGLWAGDSQRYRVGQRLLMLLHAPSAAGMSSACQRPRRSDPDSSGRRGDADGGHCHPTAATLCRSPLARGEAAARCVLSKRASACSTAG
jgi:hypothetical protein